MCIFICSRVLRVQSLNLDVCIVLHIPGIGYHCATIWIRVPRLLLHVQRFRKQKANEVGNLARQVNHLCGKKISGDCRKRVAEKDGKERWENKGGGGIKRAG